MTDWIKDWFGSDYYAMLYKHRDDTEAKLFLDNLTSLLALAAGNRVLDCGCGRGRHSVYLSEKGFETTGIDLCATNIEPLKKNESKNLAFYTHDIRNLFRINYYDAVLSLFTTFGYFEKDAENNKAIKSISSALKKNGFLVLDFMNAEKKAKELVCEEKINIDGIDFGITRFAELNFIVKEISVSHNGKNYKFREKVKCYKQAELENFFKQNGIERVHLLGDYDLNPFDETKSERLILVGKKK